MAPNALARQLTDQALREQSQTSQYMQEEEILRKRMEEFVRHNQSNASVDTVMEKLEAIESRLKIIYNHLFREIDETDKPTAGAAGLSDSAGSQV